jgi:hypothetical protein
MKTESAFIVASQNLPFLRRRTLFPHWPFFETAFGAIIRIMSTRTTLSLPNYGGMSA